MNVSRQNTCFRFNLAMWLVSTSSILFETMFIHAKFKFWRLLLICGLGFSLSFLTKKIGNSIYIFLQLFLIMSLIVLASKVPVVGVFADFSLAGVAIYPLVFLNDRRPFLTFGNLLASIFIVSFNFFSFSTKQGETDLFTVDLFLFYYKILNVVFIFFLAFYLRLLSDKIANEREHCH